MARIQYGSIVTEINGKIGGHTFSRSSYGGTISTKNNTSARKKLWAYRGNNAGITTSLNSQFWKQLTDAERAAWSAASAAHWHIDPFGNKVSLKGYTYFMRVNNRLALIGEGPLNLPMADTTLSNFNATSLTPLTVTQMSVNWTNSIAPDEWLVFLATSTNSAGAFLKKNKFKFIHAVQSPGPTTLDIISQYIALKGAPLAGGRVQVGVYILNGVTGQASPITYLTNLVS